MPSEWENSIKRKMQEASDAWNPGADWLQGIKETSKRVNKAWEKDALPYSEEGEDGDSLLSLGMGLTGEDSQSIPPFGKEGKVGIHKPDTHIDKNVDERIRHPEMPSLSQCASMLKNAVKIICVEGKLFFYERYCYQPMDRTKLIQLYRDRVDEDLHGARSTKLFGELYNYLLTDSKIQKNLDSNLSHYAVLKNGIYNIKKGKLKPHDPSLLTFSYVNASYVENKSCPCFDKFIEDVTAGNEILMERMWMFLGYVITLSLDAKVFFVLGNAPNSGKSLLGSFISKLYEPQFVSSVALSDLNGEFSLAPMVGAAVNVSMDLPGERLNSKAVSSLKRLTGGDLITVNEKYVPQFKYQNRAKLIFATNHPIELMEDDGAFWQRLIFLPFDHSIDLQDQNRKLGDKFLEEKDAIVSKALRYAEELLRRNYDFPVTDDIEKRIRRWRGLESDTIDAFLRDKCQLGEAERGEFIEILYSAYESYCMDNGEFAQSKPRFMEYLQKQRQLKRKKTRLGEGGNPRYAFLGISLCDSEEWQG